MPAPDTAKVEATLRSGCDLMRRQALSFQREIDSTNRFIVEQKQRLETVLSAPKPDQAEIAHLRESITQAESRVTEFEFQLGVLEDVITENC